MKYIVLTSRHHDGFCLFDDPDNTFTSMKSAAHRDFVAAYVPATRKAGLRVGLYYSPLDWRYPGFFLPELYRQNAIDLRDQYHRQLKELASHYGKLDILWFDGGGNGLARLQRRRVRRQLARPSQGPALSPASSPGRTTGFANLRKLQPPSSSTTAPTRPPTSAAAKAMERWATSKASTPGSSAPPSPPAPGAISPTLPSSLSTKCLHLLVGAVGRDGNLLLNVGPRPDGQIDPAQAARLREVGDWLSKYGESIYSTRGGPYLPGDFGVSTYRDKNIYLHIFNWPGDKLVLRPSMQKSSAPGP